MENLEVLKDEFKQSEKEYNDYYNYLISKKEQLLEITSSEKIRLKQLGTLKIMAYAKYEQESNRVEYQRVR